jgi:hypothetical protein
MIDRALPLDRIEEFADVFINMILLVTQHERASSDLGVPPLGLLVRHSEVVCQSEQISPGYLDSIIAAAVGWAFVAIVQNAQHAAVRFGFSVFYDGFPRDWW